MPIIDDEEREDRSEEDIVSLQKIAGPDMATMIAQEGLPGLTARRLQTHRTHVLLNRRLSVPDAELE
ncbi:MAG: hypothetical protein ACI841_003545 [Planctomycetota bacterium]